MSYVPDGATFCSAYYYLYLSVGLEFGFFYVRQMFAEEYLDVERAPTYWFMLLDVKILNG